MDNLGRWAADWINRTLMLVCAMSAGLAVGAVWGVLLTGLGAHEGPGVLYGIRVALAAIAGWWVCWKWPRAELENSRELPNAD